MTDQTCYREALLWLLGPDSCEPAKVLLLTALDERLPGMRIDPPGLHDYPRLTRLLQAMPWARAGLLPLARDSAEWAAVADVLCHNAGLPVPLPGQPQ